MDTADIHFQPLSIIVMKYIIVRQIPVPKASTLKEVLAVSTLLRIWSVVQRMNTDGVSCTTVTSGGQWSGNTASRRLVGLALTLEGTVSRAAPVATASSSSTRKGSNEGGEASSITSLSVIFHFDLQPQKIFFNESQLTT